MQYIITCLQTWSKQELRQNQRSICDQHYESHFPNLKTLCPKNYVVQFRCGKLPEQNVHQYILKHKVILPKNLKKSWLRSPDPFFGEVFRGFSLAVCFGKCTAHGARSLYPPSSITMPKRKVYHPKRKGLFSIPTISTNFPRFSFWFFRQPKTVTTHRNPPAIRSTEGTCMPLIKLSKSAAGMYLVFSTWEVEMCLHIACYACNVNIYYSCIYRYTNVDLIYTLYIIIICKHML